MTIAVTTKRFSWVPVVKITHWSIALAVLANAVFTEEDSSLHVWVGYALAAILALRLLCGLIGSARSAVQSLLAEPAQSAGTHLRYPQWHLDPAQLAQSAWGHDGLRNLGVSVDGHRNRCCHGRRSGVE